MAKKTEFLDDAVEMALYQLAIGAKYKERKTIIKNDEITEEVEIKKTLAPDLKAIQMWLAVKRPDTWSGVKSFDDEKIREILNEITNLCKSDDAE